MLERKEIIRQAVQGCFKEMYERAQPSADWEQLVKDYNEGRIGKDERVYERHYLSKEEFDYIRDKYLKAYRLKEQWRDDVETVEKYLKEGGIKDKYISEKIDKDGTVHPGYRGYGKVPPLQDAVYKLLSSKKPDEDNNILAKKITDKVFEHIKLCKDFYKFDREENEFNIAVCLGASPTCNKKTVTDYWKSKGKSIKIEDRNPDLFWEKDFYGDEFEQIMEDEYGKDWEEERWKEYKERVKAEKKERGGGTKDDNA